ncbi:hypothetical protein N499_1341 [Wolbachia pipientis wVitA]|nr:hypothetical protein N499_1341 [Wolbachia pipientis wVitA]
MIIHLSTKNMIYKIIKIFNSTAVNYWISLVFTYNILISNIDPN